MYENKYIDAKQLILNTKPILVVNRDENKFQEANYFKEEVRKQLNNLLGTEALYEEGLIVKTSIDTGLQKILDNVLINGLINQDKKNGWRGAIKNIQYPLINNNLYKEIKNPLPKRWSLVQIMDTSNRNT